jgi:DNA-binding beta-propeller fold protein YncE
MPIAERRSIARISTLLVLAVALLMTVPSVGAAGPSTPALSRASVEGSTLLTRDGSCTVGGSPQYAAYDPVNQEVYVPNSGTANISVLNGTCRVVATIALPSGGHPRVAAFDPVNNEVYVTDGHLDQVYVVSGTKLVSTISNSLFVGPWGVAFDPGSDLMAVANHGSDTVAFIAGTILLGTTTVGSKPYEFAYDPYYGKFLVTNYGSDTVTSMEATNPFYTSGYITIPVGSEPTGIDFDQANQRDYVANYGSNNVSLINGVGTEYGSVTVGSEPDGVVWDQAKLSVDVTNYGSGTVSEIQGVTVGGNITGPTGSEFEGVSYDAATDQVFVTGFHTGEVYIYGKYTPSAGPVTSGTYCTVGKSPEDSAYDPVTHEIWVPNADSDNISVLTGSCGLVATLPLPTGSQPAAAGFDPVNNRIYVTDTALNQVYVFAGTTMLTKITSPSFAGPSAILFDPGDAVMAVANVASDTVSIVQGTGVLGVAHVGSYPDAFAYDPVQGRFLVADSGSGNVTSMLAVYPFNWASYLSIPVGVTPTGIAFDYADAKDYVSNELFANVTVINGAGTQFGSIGVGSEPEGAAWDQSDLEVYVTNSGSNSVSVISGMSVARTITGPAHAQFTGITYDDATTQVFVSASYVASKTHPGDIYVYT